MADIKMNTNGLKCDNPKCDWKDESIELDSFLDWLDAPCPKCGENVLTAPDYISSMQIRDVVEYVKSIPEDRIDEIVNLIENNELENVIMKNIFGDHELGKLFEDRMKPKDDESSEI